MRDKRYQAPNPSQRAAWPAVGIASACLVLSAAAAAEPGDAPPDAPAAEPLATCQLAPLSAARSTISPVGLVMTTPNPADGLSIYRKDAFGDWPIADEVDPDDPSIDLVLATPTQSIRARIEVWLAGEPFRGVREGWIDSALNPATESGPEASDDANSDASPPPELAINREAMASRFRSASAGQWLAEYAESTAEPIDRIEARWLLAQRAGGPSLVEMAPFNTSRTNASPLRDLLDLNGDAGLDATEINAAADVLLRCDFNEDGDVDRDEVRRATPPAPPREGWKPDRLLRVVERDDAAQPDLVFRVRFNEPDAAQAVSLIRCPTANAESVRANANAIATTLGGADVEFSAAGLDALGQVSVGAVIEGEPLWSRVDTNHDDRLSQRELSAVVATLRELDRDGDSLVAATEMPTRIRLAVATGARVHALLSAPATPPPPGGGAAEETPPAPEWFVSMDANSDGDLSPAEFLGGQEQFAGLDADGDGLISPSEAAAFE